MLKATSAATKLTKANDSDVSLPQPPKGGFGVGTTTRELLVTRLVRLMLPMMSLMCARSALKRKSKSVLHRASEK